MARKIRFTDRGLRGIKATGERQMFWDTLWTEKGAFGLSVTPKGTKAFVYFCREKGGRQASKRLGRFPELSLFRGKEKARDIAAEVRHNGRVDKQEKDLTFAEVVEKWRVTKGSVRPRTLKEYDRMLEKDLTTWMKRPVKEITRNDINDLLDDIAYGKRKAPVSANRTLALVSGIFTFAFKRGHVDTNPSYLIDKRIDEKKLQRERVLSNDEIRSLYEELKTRKPSTSAIYKLVLMTAQRGGEIRQMRWDQIDFAHRIWTIPPEKTKNGREQQIPLAPAVLEILEELRNDSEFVFPSNSKSGHVAWSQANTKRILDNLDFYFRIHDLRRTAATNLSRLGADRELVAMTLNHSWVHSNVTAIYDRWSRLEEMRSLLEKWADSLAQILAADSAKVVAMR